MEYSELSTVQCGFLDNYSKFTAPSWTISVQLKDRSDEIYLRLNTATMRRVFRSLVSDRTELGVDLQSEQSGPDANVDPQR